MQLADDSANKARITIEPGNPGKILAHRRTADGVEYLTFADKAQALKNVALATLLLCVWSGKDTPAAGLDEPILAFGRALRKATPPPNPAIAAIEQRAFFMLNDRGRSLRMAHDLVFSTKSDFLGIPPVKLACWRDPETNEDWQCSTAANALHMFCQLMGLPDAILLEVNACKHARKLLGGVLSCEEMTFIAVKIAQASKL